MLERKPLIETRRGDQRGEGRIGTIIALAVLALIGYSLMKFVPVTIRSAAFKSSIKDIAMQYAVENIDEDELRTRVVEEGVDQGFDIGEDDVEVDEREKTVSVTVYYSYELMFLGKEILREYEVDEEIPRF